MVFTVCAYAFNSPPGWKRTLTSKEGQTQTEGQLRLWLANPKSNITALRGNLNWVLYGAL